MSKAFRCNRCEGFFTVFDGTQEKPFAEIPLITYKNWLFSDTHSYDHQARDIDLCPECTKAFDEWLYGFKSDESQKTQGP